MNHLVLTCEQFFEIFFPGSLNEFGQGAPNTDSNADSIFRSYSQEERPQQGFGDIAEKVQHKYSWDSLHNILLEIWLLWLQIRCQVPSHPLEEVERDTRNPKLTSQLPLNRPHFRSKVQVCSLAAIVALKKSEILVKCHRRLVVYQRGEHS